jgi:hypothetical protein
MDPRPTNALDVCQPLTTSIPLTPSQRGIELINQAIQADEQKNYYEAYQLYTHGLDYLMLTLKREIPRLKIKL